MALVDIEPSTGKLHYTNLVQYFHQLFSILVILCLSLSCTIFPFLYTMLMGVSVEVYVQVKKIDKCSCNLLLHMVVIREN